MSQKSLSNNIECCCTELDKTVYCGRDEEAAGKSNIALSVLDICIAMVAWAWCEFLYSINTRHALLLLNVHIYKGLHVALILIIMYFIFLTSIHSSIYLNTFLTCVGFSHANHVISPTIPMQDRKIYYGLASASYFGFFLKKRMSPLRLAHLLMTL